MSCQLQQLLVLSGLSPLAGTLTSSLTAPLPPPAPPRPVLQLPDSPASLRLKHWRGPCSRPGLLPFLCLFCSQVASTSCTGAADIEVCISCLGLQAQPPAGCLTFKSSPSYSTGTKAKLLMSSPQTCFCVPCLHSFGPTLRVMGWPLCPRCPHPDSH